MIRQLVGWGCRLRLFIFVIFMCVAALAMAVTSYVAGVSLGGIALRVMAVLVALQVVYFLLILAVSLLPAKKPEKKLHSKSLPHSAKTKASSKAHQ